MSDTRKKEIIMAALELAANKGLGNVSMNMIADKVGIKKPSLYNHFASKEELVEVMYQFLREEAKKNANIGAIDYTIIFEMCIRDRFYRAISLSALHFWC